MAPKSQQNSKPKKRKQISGNKSSSHGSISKKPKFVDSKSSKSPRLGTVGKPFKPPKQKENQHFKSNVVKAEARKENSVPTTNRDRRVQAKVCSCFIVSLSLYWMQFTLYWLCICFKHLLSMTNCYCILTILSLKEIAQVFSFDSIRNLQRLGRRKGNDIMIWNM